MSNAGQYNFCINRGAGFIHKIVWKAPNGNPINLAGYTCRMQVRSYLNSNNILLDLTSENGKIAVTDALAGEITINVPSGETVLLDGNSSGVYDLEVISSGNIVTRLLQGSVYISQEVTR